MSDFRSPADDALPSLSLQTQTSHRRDFSGAMTSEDPTPSQVAEEAPISDGVSIDRRTGDGESIAPTAEVEPRPPADPTVLKHVTDVLSSEQGIPSLLQRLKQSIASAREFAAFLKKRAGLEEDHAQSLKKLCRSTQDSIRRPEHRGGSFVQVYEEMMHVHERMAENGIQFSSSLHQMQEELAEAAANAERGRKVWKANGLAAEQKVVDLEQAMRKSKAKYDSLAEEYDRARTGEGKQGGVKVLGAFKAHKSAAQQEEELLRKVQVADTTYHHAVTTLQSEKSQLQSTIRPDAVKALQETISEIDSAVTMQMQKFASNNENLLLGNGLIISPFKNPTSLGSHQPRSLRQAVASIDNEKDLNDFIAGNHQRVLPNTGEIKYERHPVLNPQPTPLSQSQSSVPQPAQQPPQQPNPVPNSGPAPSPGGFQPQQSMSMVSRTSTGNMSSPGGPLTSHGQPPPFSQGSTPTASNPPRVFPQQSHNRSFSQGNMLNSPSGSQPPPQFGASGPAPTHSRFGNGGGSISAAGPPQLGALPFQDSQGPSQKMALAQAGPFEVPGSNPPPAYGTPSHPPPNLAPPALSVSTSSKPVFGIHLSRLYERDGLAVPMVVYQCIQAVDLFGLGVEGIYRQSGSLNHINKLKSMFDSESQSQALDFRNPENFFHDVNSVTGLLKQFLRDLPDPLFTIEHHNSFINAAKAEDEIVRRDSLHAIINSLPDPNYATLRALMLHLHRVIDNSHINRMNSHNLAVILGPTLMGTDPSTAIADAGWQIKVIDTILINTYQIFDED